MSDRTAEQVDALNRARLDARDPERAGVRVSHLALRGNGPDGRPLAAPLTAEERAHHEARVAGWKARRLELKQTTPTTEGNHEPVREEPEG